MRLSLSVNGEHRFIASQPHDGFLNAHLNLAERPKENEHTKVIRVVGTELRESETLRLEWPTTELNSGDVIEIQLLPEGKGDEPSTIRKSSEHPDNLFSDLALAKEFMESTTQFEARLRELLRKSKAVEPSEEHKKIASAVGHVLAGLGQSLWYPILRRHKELIPESMKGELF